MPALKNLPSNEPVIQSPVKILTSTQAPSSSQRNPTKSNLLSNNTNHKSIVDVLVEKGLLTLKRGEEIRLEFINTGVPVEQIIHRDNLVSEDDMVVAKAAFYNIPIVYLSEIPSSPDALNLLPRVVAEANKVIPLSYDKKEKVLSIAMVNPLDLEVVDFIESKTGTRVKPFIAPAAEVSKAILERYGTGLTTEVTAALKEAVPEAGVRVVDIKHLGEVIREAPIAKIVSTLLEFAAKSRASDIHIEPQEDKTRVRYRIDGILHEKLILPREVHEALVSRIKILSGLKIDEKRIPQDGRFNFRSESDEVDLRVSTLPTNHGEKIVMRLLRKTKEVPTTSDLGLRGRALKNLEDAILRPHGIVLICGPTGSGKTTTLYAILSKINTSRVNIMTLEDPVEYEIPGVNQVQINPAVKLTFATGLRAFLRQDPNVIMVGEIRDSETAELAIQASLTGHLVFSTLHTNTAAGALPRLLDMGAEPFLLASSMTAIVAQRICRKICLSCKEGYEPLPEVIEDMAAVLGKLWDKSAKKIILFRGKGCPECNNTGYLGRVGIFEVLPVTERIGRLILERSPAGKIEEEAVAEGMVNMKQDGYLKVIEGTTTMEEVLRVAQD